MPQQLDEVEQRVLDRELKAEEEAKKARKAREAGDDPEMANIINDFVAQCDDPNYFRTVYDKITGKKVVLSDHDLDVIDRIRKAIYPDPNYDPYEPYVDFFSNEVSIHPVMNRPEPKAAFVPSLSEKRALSKLVAFIKSGRLKPYKPKKKDRDPYKFTFDLWLKDGDVNDRRHRAHIPAPKMQLPGHAESYNPPPEYLLTADDVKKWESQTEEEREHFFLPQRFSSLRAVPFYKNIIRERFERCLELYMCPRQRIRRAKVDPESLIPKLPRPRDLQPFPSSQSIIYKGHTDIVHSVSVEPQGQFIVSGSEDCTVKFWEILNGRCWRTIKFDAPVRIVSYCPNAALSLVAVVTTTCVYMINSQLGDSGIIQDTEVLFDTIESELAVKNGKTTQNGNSNGASDPNANDSDDESSSAEPQSSTHKTNQPVNWQVNDDNELYSEGVRLKLWTQKTIDQFTWHPRGDYFAIVMPEARSLSLIVAHLARHQSQYVFKKGKHLVQRVAFHPKKPRLFAADDREVIIYDLAKKEVVKKLTSGLKSSSCIAVHPGGDNLLLGSYEPRLVWFDTDLSVKPYKIMRYHTQAIREACFHQKYPLFASCSDDAHVIVSHGMVYDDLAQNALIVPLKILHGHEHCATHAVTDCEFHKSQPWIFSSGADKTLRLYT
jgi:ribosome biogenesis protein ERB1